MTRIYSFYTGILCLMNLVVRLSVAEAPEQPTSSPTSAPGFNTSPIIPPQPLSAEVRSLIASLVTVPENDQKIVRLRKQLCASTVRPPSAEAASAKAALALTESNLSVELAFAKEKEEPHTSRAANSFSLFIDFRFYDILLRSTLPRFRTAAGGILAVPEKAIARTYWMEGKDGTDLLIYTPPLAECGIKAVAICPRSFVPRKGLQRNEYVPTAASYYYSTKADGLFATEEQQLGRVRASSLTSQGIATPEKWFDEQLWGANPSATFKHSVVRPKDRPDSFFPISLPSVAAVEARLELGQGETLLRTISKRSSIEISEFQLPEKQVVEVHLTNTEVQGGSCFLVATWNETQL